MARSLAIGVVALVAAMGWSRAASPHETVNTTVLFDREIVAILNRHCAMCHAEKGPAFPLETYEQVWLQKRKVSAAVLARHMPPWAAFPGYGRFANENAMTLRESQFIVSWMEGLGPRNAGKVFTNTSSAAGSSHRRQTTSGGSSSISVWQPLAGFARSSICPATAASCARRSSPFRRPDSGSAAGRRGTAS